MEQQTVVIIVGAGPAGLSVAACLNLQGIPNIVLERDDCSASLWKKRSYDRLKLHLAKEFCQLPHMPFPSDAPTFVPKNDFIKYLDDYTSFFEIDPFYCRIVESASFDVTAEKWLVLAKNALIGATEIFSSKFLVVASGENSEGFIPNLLGIDSFDGVAMHTSHYENGEKFIDREVLVVGSGNSGMEIAYDLANWGAITSIVIRSPTKPCSFPEFISSFLRNNHEFSDQALNLHVSSPCFDQGDGEVGNESVEIHSSSCGGQYFCHA